MSEPSAGQRAVAAFEIDDVFMVSSNCQLDRQFNQTELVTEVSFQHRVGLEPTIIGQTRVPHDEGEATVRIVRYFVTGEVRLLKPGVEIATEAGGESAEIPDSDLIATIKVTFAADYRCTEANHEDRDAISAFGRNALFHVWPYWRESVHDHVARMRLPRITIPMMKPGANPAPVPGIEDSSKEKS